MRAALTLVVLALIGLLARPGAAAVSPLSNEAAAWGEADTAPGSAESEPGGSGASGADPVAEDAESAGEVEADDGPEEARAAVPLLRVAAPSPVHAALVSGDHTLGVPLGRASPAPRPPNR